MGSALLRSPWISGWLDGGPVSLIPIPHYEYAQAIVRVRLQSGKALKHSDGTQVFAQSSRDMLGDTARQVFSVKQTLLRNYESNCGKQNSEGVVDIPRHGVQTAWVRYFREMRG